MKLFNTSSMDIINNCRQYFDVKLPSTLWSDRVGRFEKKFAECDDLSLQNFSLNSIIYIYLLVKFLFCLFFCFFFYHVDLPPVMVNEDVLYRSYRGRVSTGQDTQSTM